jgi:hypothetical protein
MATTDIAKMSVFDPRIVQNAPAFAVNKGALSVSVVPFAAISQTTAQHTYNVNIPSQNIYCDRGVDWISTFRLRVRVVTTVPPAEAIPALPAFDPILKIGRDFALTNFPLNSLCSTIQATINDTTVTMNTSDVLKEVLRLTSYKKNKSVRTCPTMDDNYQNYNAASGSMNSPLSGYNDAGTTDSVGNGAYPGLRFTNAQGQALVGDGVYNDGTINVQYRNGIPIRTVASDAGCFVFLEVTSIEKLCLSPFVFADSHSWETGLFGLNAIQFVMNIGSPARVIRSTSNTGRTLSQIGFNGDQFFNSQIQFSFLTPSLDLPLPPKSCVSYAEFPRYITNYTAEAIIPGRQNGGEGGTFVIPSQTIVLPQIPDMLLIYARPTTYTGTVDADFHFPPQRISVNWDNFSGLLSSHTQTQLYSISTHNGLDMSYPEWVGAGYTTRDGRSVPLVGGFLVLKLGQDITLQAGQASGLAGNYVLQYQLTVRNHTFGDIPAGTPIQLYTVAVNSGFFESMAGSSRVVKSVLSEADVISAEPAPAADADSLKRIVGAGFFNNLGSMLHRATSIYRTAKPLLSEVKKLLPEEGKLGTVRKGMDMAGLGVGMSGGQRGMSGGVGVGMSGGQRGAKMSLASRLM